ncbi:hypothetical protein GCM10009678_87690 [Actinomadura kijaniata]|uniref:Purine-cytosine permease-like protein n=1 Tax=Actinomadura namibiensis TaxID=182080 RepID=A0A7W3QP18_ACTNM|nr:hypothetical protein [Actinomadura namibiensis]MBA8953653.1 purine-cytosine permease-like protein [Actinomadura namibiensis]
MGAAPSAAPPAGDPAHSLEPVPPAARGSTAAHRFWIWSGANIAPINWVLGAQTADWHVSRRAISYGAGAFATVLTILLIFQEDFAHTLDAWLAGLVTSVVPWAAVMAVHFYVVKRRNVDIDALYDPPGRSRLGDFRWDGLAAFALSAAATWCFQHGVPAALRGPAARALGGVDLSWLAGTVVAGGLYLLLSSRRKGTLA